MTTIYVTPRGQSQKTIHMDEDDVHQVILDWSEWLGSSTIASAAWEKSPTSLTLSNEANTTTTATNYLTAGDGYEDSEFKLKCTITTADSPARKESRTILIRII